MSTGYLLKSLGWVIQAVKHDGSVWYIQMGYSGPYELVEHPVIYTREQKDRYRARLVSNFGFGENQSYPYDIECWQTAEIILNSNF